MIALWTLLLRMFMWETAPAPDEEAPGEQEDEEPEDIKDPEAKIKSMQDHLNRLHKKIEIRDEQLKELQVAAILLSGLPGGGLVDRGASMWSMPNQIGVMNRAMIPITAASSGTLITDVTPASARTVPIHSPICAHLKRRRAWASSSGILLSTQSRAANQLTPNASPTRDHASSEASRCAPLVNDVLT